MTTFVPRHSEIEQTLRARIGELQPDQPLPSDRGTYVADSGPHRKASNLMIVEQRVILDANGEPRETCETRYAAGRYAIDVDFVVERPEPAR